MKTTALRSAHNNRRSEMTFMKASEFNLEDRVNFIRDVGNVVVQLLVY